MRFIYILFSAIFSISILAQSLPPVKIDYASYVVTHDGKLLGYYGEKNRVDAGSTGQISRWVLYSLVATEDRDFYNHDGVSYKGLGRAVLKTLTGSTQGGSTLTMQLARNLFLTNQKTLSRKLEEIEIAQALEEKYSKDQLLLMYLNTVNFGHGAYGIWAAAQEYFSKTPDKLTITESAMLVGLLQSPNGYNPEKNPGKTLSRRNEVLYNLVEVGKLTSRDYKKYKKMPLGLKMRERVGRHFIEQVRREAVSILKNRGIYLNKNQLKITTTIDWAYQKAAEDAVKAQWNNFPASMQNAQIGLAAVEPLTGMIKALVGGNPESEARGLNRAVQVKRQPGSSFKVFLYGLLLESGYTLGTPIYDTPITITDTITGVPWSPQNSTNEFTYQPTPIINAIQHSVNAVAAHAIHELTVPDSIVSFAHRLGIQSDIPAYPSISLGTGEVTPLEMAASTAVFASEGMYTRPFSIIKIEDKNHRLLYSAITDTVNVLDSATAFLMTTALQAVVDSGTATSVRKYYHGTAAGKTGTTQNSTDAWFIGYNPRLATAIWIGYDNPERKLGGGFQYGGSAAAPIWARMMADISHVVPGFYGAEFIAPSNIHYIELCTESGHPASVNCQNRKLYPVDILKLKSECPVHAGLSSSN